MARATRPKEWFHSSRLQFSLRALISRSSNSLAEWMSRNPDNENIKPWMFRETAKKIASRDPGLAASWLESNLGNKSVNGEVVGQVASSWVEKDPAAAANWVSSLKGTRVYDKELTKKLGGAWARNDPEAALEWAQTLDPKLWNATSASIIGKLKQGRACPQCSVDQGKLYGRAP